MVISSAFIARGICFAVFWNRYLGQKLKLVFGL